MQYVNLGRTGLKVSRLVLGTMNFGPITSEDDSHAILNAAADKGINFIDTANVYGTIVNRGTEPRVGWTEEILGRWFKARPAVRDNVVLATKCYIGMGPGPNNRGLSAYHIRRACDASLRRMQVDHIDLYQMHHIDRATPWDEIWQAMEQLVREGKITYVGSSNFAGWHIATACQEARRRNGFGLVSEQSKFSLLMRTPELEVLPACEHYGLGFIAWSPVSGGMLAGVLGKQVSDKARRSGGMVQNRLEPLRPQLEKYEALCREIGHDPAEVALAWVLHQPHVTGPIIGPRVMEHLDSSLRALEIKLDEAALKKLDEIFPGPGGPAPEAYAW